MQLNKAMIDLINEVRRRAPSEEKPSIKLANPDILHVLLELAVNSQDAVTKALIKEVCALAGPPWPEQLELQSAPEQIRYHSKVYRGQTELVEVAAPSNEVKRSKPKGMYRGQVIN